MKQKILLLISLILFFHVSLFAAADYLEVGKPICVEGRQWVYEAKFDVIRQLDGQSYMGPDKTSMTIEFKGDTVINGVTYKKCWRTYGKNATAFSSLYEMRFGEEREREITDTPVVIGYCMDLQFPNRFPDDPLGGLFQLRVIYSDEYKKEMVGYNTGTHQLFPDNNDIHLMWQFPMEYYPEEYGTGSWKYDFKLWFTDMMNYLRLNQFEREYVFNFSSAETEMVGGEPRLKLVGEAHKEFSKYYSYWIDGIGYVFSTEGQGAYDLGGRSTNLISPLGTYNDWSILTRLSHVVENGEIIYKTPDFQEWLVPSSGVRDITAPISSSAEADDAYYNLQGQRVDNPSAGIYIHGGKKVVVK